MLAVCIQALTFLLNCWGTWTRCGSVDYVTGIPWVVFLIDVLGLGVVDCGIGQGGGIMLSRRISVDMLSGRNFCLTSSPSISSSSRCRFLPAREAVL